jgi:hypothetical protein
MSKRILVLFLFLCHCRPTNALENLALHKSYTLSPKPSYSLCTDEEDSIQLTDGKSHGSQWTHKSTVGWRTPEPAVEIIIDLAGMFAVEQVRISTVGGGVASVEYPEFAAVLLSEDGRRYKFAGLVTDRDTKDVRGFGYRGVPRKLSIKNINAPARYVKLVIRPNGLTFFTDEVEVLGEGLSNLGNHHLRDNLEVFETYDELLKRIDDYLQLQQSIAVTSKALKEARLQFSKQAPMSKLSEFEMPSQEINFPKNTIFSTDRILDVKGEMGEIRAGIYRVTYKKPFVCLPANPMEVLFEKEVLLHEKSGQIAVEMWQREYESAAFNIINCSDEAMKMSVSASDLSGFGGQKIESDKTFTIRRAVYIKAGLIGSIADALVLQNERPFSLKPGEVTQIWLTIFNPYLTVGKYKGDITISATTEEGKTLPAESVPIALDVHENRFPDKVALKTCNWAYYQVASEAEMAEDLRSHHTNVYVIPAQDLPFLRFASDPPGVTRKPDCTRLDEVLMQHKYAQEYLIGLNFSIAKKDFGRFGNVEWMTPAWNMVFSSWLKDLVGHLKSRGVDYDRFVLYPYDESIADDYYELAKLIKQIDPKIRLYANSFGKGPKEFKRFRELIDVWCLQDSHCERHPDWFETIKSFGKELWTYECLRPMKSKEPYSYYRLLTWRAFKRGMNGAGFWIYYYGLGFKAGAVPWDDTLRPHGFSGVVYGANAAPVSEFSEGIIPSRRWEAWREGVEDYQYLFELQQEINEIRTKNPRAAEEAQQVLDHQVNRVLNNQSDSEIVYDARKILTDTLLKLKADAN